MHSYTLIAPAKINLYLEIVGDRPDGYHELVMIMQSVGLSDRLTLRPNGAEEFRLYCADPRVPADNTNLAYRAATLMAGQFPKVFANLGGVDISIEKNIPIAAGLAGGSADAAAVLVGLDLVWNLGLTRPELQALAARLGSDIPFCVAGGTAMATGRGEILDPLPDLDGLWVVLAKYNSLAVSTYWAYSAYRECFQENYISSPEGVRSRLSEVSSGNLVRAIARKDGVAIGQLLHNDLEKVVLPEYSLVVELREVLARSGGLGTMMSGSGPTVFTLCRSREEAIAIRDNARQVLPDPDLEFWVAPLCTSGIQVSSEM
ncbi:4-(cytidine 5'-diphospho)-2-C-methyl-D-erythritol kinase [Pannus brasiliensis CCIBt3594]|uniref:4-diphosphocytidyl-2-C-methyl-D-erythritol kinase n=1 Tax=Pannus brasiliensis CCIBt3594 TaxID=1427578 RepID=A0AAW9R0U8_9CHRO